MKVFFSAVFFVLILHGSSFAAGNYISLSVNSYSDTFIGTSGYTSHVFVCTSPPANVKYSFHFNVLSTMSDNVKKAIDSCKQKLLLAMTNAQKYSVDIKTVSTQATETTNADGSINVNFSFDSSTSDSAVTFGCNLKVNGGGGFNL